MNYVISRVETIFLEESRINRGCNCSIRTLVYVYVRYLSLRCSARWFQVGPDPTYRDFVVSPFYSACFKASQMDVRVMGHVINAVFISVLPYSVRCDSRSLQRSAASPSHPSPLPPLPPPFVSPSPSLFSRGAKTAPRQTMTNNLRRARARARA